MPIHLPIGICSEAGSNFSTEGMEGMLIWRISLNLSNDTQKLKILMIQYVSGWLDQILLNIPFFVKKTVRLVTHMAVFLSKVRGLIRCLTYLITIFKCSLAYKKLFHQ